MENTLNWVRDALARPYGEEPPGARVVATWIRKGDGLSRRLQETLVLSPLAGDFAFDVLKALPDFTDLGVALRRAFLGGGTACTPHNDTRAALLRVMLRKSSKTQLSDLISRLKTTEQLEYLYNCVVGDERLYNRCMLYLSTAAVRLKHDRIYEELLADKAEQRSLLPWSEERSQIAQLWVLTIAKYGTAEMMKHYLNYTARASGDPDAVNSIMNAEGPVDRTTPLMIAAARGDASKVRLLLEHGAIPGTKDAN